MDAIAAAMLDSFTEDAIVMPGSDGVLSLGRFAGFIYPYRYWKVDLWFLVLLRGFDCGEVIWLTAALKLADHGGWMGIGPAAAWQVRT